MKITNLSFLYSFEGWQLSLASSKDGDQESRRCQCSDCEWKSIKRILPQIDKTCWTSFDGYHRKEKILQSSFNAAIADGGADGQSTDAPSPC